MNLAEIINAASNPLGFSALALVLIFLMFNKSTLKIKLTILALGLVVFVICSAPNFVQFVGAGSKVSTTPEQRQTTAPNNQVVTGSHNIVNGSGTQQVHN
ncbi:MAG TPA: hypothetical protein V6C81_07305 [Planktothrix sp.]|jgi:hypothetical protein